MVGMQPPQAVPASHSRPTCSQLRAPRIMALRICRSVVPLHWQTIMAGTSRPGGMRRPRPEVYTDSENQSQNQEKCRGLAARDRAGPCWGRVTRRLSDWIGYIGMGFGIAVALFYAGGGGDPGGRPIGQPQGLPLRPTRSRVRIANLGWLTGFEPATSGTTIRRSNRLSYSHLAASREYPHPVPRVNRWMGGPGAFETLGPPHAPSPLAPDTPTRRSVRPLRTALPAPARAPHALHAADGRSPPASAPAPCSRRA